MELLWRFFENTGNKKVWVKERERQCTCVCVCVCKRAVCEIERATETLTKVTNVQKSSEMFLKGRDD